MEKTRADVKVERVPFNFYIYRDLPYTLPLFYLRASARK